MSKHIVY